ncbi:MAG: hypothetical protein IPK71_35715 [Myxococcales bacterium]|nr:hypothetical protein [Myxococcales bacterium]MBL9111728.1 hypothetical protein [Myxococcales bacterium]
MRTSTAIGLSLAILSLGAAGSIAACTSTTRPAIFDDGGSDTGTTTEGPGDEAGSLFEDAAPQEDLSPKGTWTGTVYTPAAKVPVASALVYLTTKKPDPLPSGNFCDTCIPLEKTIPQTLSKADGTFTIVANRLGPQFLVIQKGTFRRVVEVNVKEGDLRLSESDTTLPRQNDTAKGDQVPSIFLSKGNFDDIGATLAKLGITPTRTLDQSQERTSLSNVTELAKYHVVFLPCGSCVTNETNNNGTAEDPAIKGALRDYVTKGGKVYVTDWKQGFVSEGFPGYVDFAQAKGCTGGGYDVNAIVKDQGLDDWLKAQGTTGSFQLKANYQRINGVRQVYLEDGDGGTRVYSPKVWMSGNQSGSEKPQTVSFEYGCGRVLYSTYHTETSATAPLDEQEKALFYILFEVASTCVVDPIIPK